MEVMSPDDPKRDRETKRREYALARIPEYWLIDPRDETVTVLTLSEGSDAYAVHGVFPRGTQASSLTLPGFVVEVEQLFAQDG
jgi:Uma2 family endonuclease